jgi:hypothetical protein
MWWRKEEVYAAITFADCVCMGEKERKMVINNGEEKEEGQEEGEEEEEEGQEEEEETVVQYVGEREKK